MTSYDHFLQKTTGWSFFTKNEEGHFINFTLLDSHSSIFLVRVLVLRVFLDFP